MKQADFKQSNNNTETETDFHGASIVTASGEEIPITEKMLQQSFAILIKAWEKSHPQKPLGST
jgi:hypothetical protein